MPKIFSYGTLNLHHIQYGLWGETKSGKVSKLDNYELKVFQNGIYYVEKNFGETVAGKVYELTKEQLEATDHYETEAYVKHEVEINGEKVLVYVINEEYFNGQGKADVEVSEEN